MHLDGVVQLLDGCRRRVPVSVEQPAVRLAEDRLDRAEMTVRNDRARLVVLHRPDGQPERSRELLLRQARRLSALANPRAGLTHRAAHAHTDHYPRLLGGTDRAT